MEQPFLNISFMLASVMSLALLSGRNRIGEEYDEDQYSECSDNESEIDLSKNPLRNHSFVYTTLLKSMEKPEDARFEKMLTFQEMMGEAQGRRRCYSADDIDALMLIPDNRIKSIFDEALEELLKSNREGEDAETEGRLTPTLSEVSVQTNCSWDKID